MNRGLGSFTGNKRYTPIRLLGMGGMGAVYEVEDVNTGARLALKVMLAQEPQRLLRFKQEFRVVAELHHPNLVKLFELGVEDEQWFFTMELLDGEPLLSALCVEERDDAERPQAPSLDGSPNVEGPACDLSLFVLYLGQILDAVEYLHQRGIVHRDIKPSNIIVGRDNQIRLLDFGVANSLGSGGLTGEGSLLGTMEYISPEQCSGEPATPASDLYALGCIMFQLLTGRLPFNGNAAQLIQARTTQAAPRVAHCVGGVPSAISEICDRLLLRSATERPSIQEVRAALGLGVSAESGAPEALFLGRDAELTALLGSLSRAGSGVCTAALISGESGIGKSSLAAIASERARQQGFLCIRGRCYERERVPFAALDRAIDSLVVYLASAPREKLAALSSDIEEARLLFPAFGVLLPRKRGREAERPIDPRERSRRAIRGFCSIFARWQAHAPIFLLLDDLQWADIESIELLEALLSQRQGRILLLVLSRPEGFRPESPLWRLKPFFAEGLQLSLSALNQEDVSRLIAASSAGQLAPDIQEALTREAQGSPFLAVRMATHLAKIPGAEQRALLAVESKSAWLQGSLRGLSQPAERLLSLAATSGGDLSVSLLAAASQLSAEDFALALRELMSARLCKALPGERLDLYHDQIREAAYARLDAQRRKALHRDLAVALESNPKETAQRAEALFLQWSSAGDEPRRRRYAREAAEESAAKLAFRRAIELFLVALESPSGASTEVAALWERVGELYEYNGQPREAAESLQRAHALWEPSSAPEKIPSMLRLRGKIAANLASIGELNGARAFCERGLSLLGLTLQRSFFAQIMLLLWLQLRVALSPLVGRSAQPTALEEEELSFFSRLTVILAPLWSLSAAEMSMRYELLGRRLNDKVALVRTLASKAIVPVFFSDASPARIASARRSLDAAEEINKSYPVPLGEELISFNRGLLLMISDAEAAKAANLAAQDGLSRAGMMDTFDGSMIRTVYLMVLAFKDDYYEAIRAAKQDIERRHPNFFHYCYAFTVQTALHSLHGDIAAAEEALSQVERLLVAVPLSTWDFSLLISRCHLLNAKGEHAKSWEMLQQREPEMKRVGVQLSRLEWSLWGKVCVDAALGLSQKGVLTPAQRRKARSYCRWLSRRGILGHESLGLRGLALLSQNDAPGAARAMQSALARPIVNPFFRWMCLESARQMGLEIPELQAERLRLIEQGHSPLSQSASTQA